MMGPFCAGPSQQRRGPTGARLRARCVALYASICVVLAIGGAALLAACSAAPAADAALRSVPVSDANAAGAASTPAGSPAAAAAPVESHAAASTPPESPAAAADAGPAAIPAPAAAASAAPGGAGYLLVVGDEFDVRVADAPQYDQTVKVRPDGKVSLSVVGSVYVAGRSPEDVQSELRERYRLVAGAAGGREYLIHANDELEIKFPYYLQLNDQMRVRPDGKIQLQLAGTVQAEGLSPEELEHELQHRYAHYLKEPELSVIVRTATSQAVRTAGGTGRGGLTGLEPLVIVRSFQTPQIFVTGEVGRPGMIAYAPGLTLLQALAEAGGHLPSADVTKLVILRRTAAQTATIIRPGLTKTYRSAPTVDVTLEPYDVVLLPPTRAQSVAEAMDAYVYKIIAPLKNSSFSYVWSRATTIY